MRKTINTAKKVALRDGYNQIVVKEKDDEYTILRDYTNQIIDGRTVANVIQYWDNGIAKTKIKYPLPEIMKDELIFETLGMLGGTIYSEIRARNLTIGTVLENRHSSIKRYRISIPCSITIRKELFVTESNSNGYKDIWFDSFTEFLSYVNEIRSFLNQPDYKVFDNDLEWKEYYKTHFKK